MKMRSSTRRALPLVALAATLHGLVVPLAAAQSAGADGGASTAEPVPEGADGLNEQGLELYAARDYRHALEKFIGAYALRDDPNLLFNIGRCYERLGELDAALEKYEQYVAAPESEAGAVARARASIEHIRGEQRAEAPAPARAIPVAAPPRPVEPVMAELDGSGAGWAPWLTLGGTVALAALGATFYALGAHDHAQITNLPGYGEPTAPAPITWRRAEELVHSGNTKKVVGGVALGASAALTATTVFLFLREGSSEPAERGGAFEPAALRGGGGVRLSGSF